MYFKWNLNSIYVFQHIFIVGQLNGGLLGDSGYPLKQYLMTPYTYADSNYNSAH